MQRTILFFLLVSAQVLLLTAYAPGNTVKANDGMTHVRGMNETDNALGNLSVNANPLAEEIMLNYGLQHPSRVQILLADKNGRAISSLLAHDRQAPGAYSYTINVSRLDLKPGSYLVKFSINGQQVAKKIVVTN